MSMRLIAWTVMMAYAVFLLAGRGSFLPVSVTTSGVVMGAGLGLIMGMMFSHRASRKIRSR
jgi:hypothetical protein